MEKRLIDANKIEYENIYVYPTGNSNYKECVGKSAKIREAETVLTIPDNPTNGDMIKALFPDTEEIEDKMDEISVYVLGSYRSVNKSWWNAPYNGAHKILPDVDMGRMM